MSGGGDHRSDRSESSSHEEPPRAPKVVVVDSNDTEELRRRYEALLAKMTNEIDAAIRIKTAAKVPEFRPSRNNEPTTPRARRKDKGKAALTSFSNSHDVVGRVGRDDFYDTAEQREYEAFIAAKAAKEDRRTHKAYDTRYGVGTSKPAKGRRYASSPTAFHVNKFRRHQSPLTPHSKEETDAEASTDAEEFADDREQEEGNSHAHFSNLPPIRDSPEMQAHSRDYIPPPKDRRFRATHDAMLARHACAAPRHRDHGRRHTPTPPTSGDDSPHSNDGRYPPRRREPET